jgi:hypothetical protein
LSQETHWDDQMILAALDGLERGTDPSASASRGDETAETLARLYTEVLGLIPYELAPAAPSALAKQRLMAVVTGAQERHPEGESRAGRIWAEERSALPDPSARPSLQDDTHRPVPVIAPPPVLPPPEEPILAPVPEPQPDVIQQPTSAVRRQPPRPMPLSARRSYGWPAALAAMLLLALGLSGWLYLQQADQRATIARLKQEARTAQQREAQATQKAERFEKEFTDLRTTLTLVTAPAALVGPLRPVGPLQPDARGALFVAADHQHWHLSIEGLKPSPGKVYQLWFVAEQGPPVSGGTFVVTGGERVELSSEAMPPDTKSAIITLEELGGVPAPKGPEVLRAAQMQQIL